MNTRAMTYLSILASFFILLSALGAIAQETAVPEAATAPKISVSPTLIDFGKVNINKSKYKTLTIKNTGTAVLDGSVYFGGERKSNFNLDTTPFALKPKKRQTFKVEFNPLAVGIQTETLWVQSNDPNSLFVEVHLVGEGVCKGPGARSALKDYNLEIILNVDIPIGMGFFKATGRGTIPLEFSPCPDYVYGWQVHGKGHFDISYSSHGDCDASATYTQPVEIEAASSEVGPTGLSFYVIFPLTSYQEQLCCIGVPCITPTIEDAWPYPDVVIQLGLTDEDKPLIFEDFGLTYILHSTPLPPLR